jgi:microcystin degradation protein MlrC
MNIAVGGFFHESNTFNPLVTSADDFIVYEGEQIYASAQAYLLAKGILDYFAQKPQYHVIPLVFARAVPNGEVDEAYYNRLKHRFFEMLADAGPVDAFVLALHGSMRVKNLGSAEEDLLWAIRALFPITPIICGLDMHATMTPAMLELGTAYVGFKTAPHIDAYETGQLAAQMADRKLGDGTPLHMAYRKLDYLIAGEKSETDCAPMREMMARAREMEQDPDVCAVSLLLGFPWADALDNGVTALAVATNPARAEACAAEMAEMFETARNRFSFSSPAYPPDEALRRALAEPVRPVFLSDSGDNPTAGSTADNTVLLRLIRDLNPTQRAGKRILFAGMFDPAAYRLCAGNLGREIELDIGGRFDTMYCQPLRLRGTPVKEVREFGVYRSGLILFSTEACDVIVTSKHIGFTGVEMFRALDIDYMNTDLVAVKLGYLTEEFKEIAAASYMALSQGCTDEVLERLAYCKPYILI